MYPLVGCIELTDRLSEALSLVPSNGIEKNAPLRGKALTILSGQNRVFQTPARRHVVFQHWPGRWSVYTSC